MSWLALPAVPVVGFAILFGMARVEAWLTQTGAVATAIDALQDRED